MPSPRSFPQRAALLCLVLACASLVVNFGPRWGLEDSPLKQAAGLLSFALIAASILSGIVALLGIPRNGTEGILRNALVGLAIDGAFVAFFVVALLMASRGGLPGPEDLELRSRRVGTWASEDAARGTRHELRLGADGRFRFLTTGKGVADFSGAWAVQNRHLYLAVESIADGNREKIPNRIRWSIERLDAGNLVCGSASGDEHFRRADP